MANLKITNVPQTNSVAATDEFYIKTGNNFRRAPVSKLLDLAATEKILYMTKSGDVYTYASANFTFTTLDELIQLCQSGVLIWLANSSTGSIYQAVNARGASSTGRLTFAGPTLESDNGDLSVEAFVVDGSFAITRKVLTTGGGSADVTSAAVASAIAGFNSTQASTARTGMDAEQAGAAATVQGNLDAVTAKIPNDASSSNQLATKADLPVFSNRNATTDTVEVKQDPTTKKCYVPASGGGGGSSAPDVVYINLDLTNPTSPTITGVTDSNNQALSLSGLATKLASGPVRILSPVDQNGTVFEWEVCGQSSTQIAVYTNVPETTVRYLYTAFLTETSSVLGGTIYRQKIGTGNANDPTYSGNSNTTVSQSLAANTVYRFGYTAAADNTPESWAAVTSLTITNIPGNRAGIAVVKFLSGATPTVFTKPASLTMPDGFAPAANTMYEISIMDGLACVQSWGWS